MIDFALNNAWLIPLLPALAFALIVFVTKPSQKLSAFISILGILVSFVLSVAIGIGVFQRGELLIEHPLKVVVTWFSMHGLAIDVGTQIDPTSAMMLFVVTLVASLVQIYSLGYMYGDPGFSRFYSYLSLFAASMLGLVIAPNLLQMFVFWELVGLCSYLLIGFWYERNSAREAAKKAFITCRAGDFGLLLGIILLQVNFGTLDLQELAEMIPNFAQYTTLSVGALTAIAIVLFLGPMAKSGQFPFHVWLPDAMEGPTPVSALIHAATMVVAGVYLVGRTLTLFITLPTAMVFVAIIGGFTAIFAASIALTQTEMKKILAYSTVSQLGYMMLALGAGSLTASMFHLFTHAFFKALLFLCAGAVLHAMHNEASIAKYGGLKKYMPVTYWTMLVGCLAISGIFPFAGFFSKDLILEVTYAASSLSGHAAGPFQGVYTVLFILAALTALLTAFYMFRMFFICFHGELRSHEAHPHEAPKTMTIPLIILAVFSLVGGWVGWPGLGEGQAFGYFVRLGHFHEVEANWFLIILSTVLALIGIGTAALFYLKKAFSAEAVAQKIPFLYKLSLNKYYIDEFYLWVIHHIIDGFGRILWWVDVVIVDGIVNGLARLTRDSGDAARKVNTGNLQHYAMVFFVGVIVLIMILTTADLSQLNIGLLGGVK
ncbi:MULTISPECIES: NADH-quinone oxidoreductase subunit L [Dehalobacter]|jgi:proton-translocating NADH-quinone oxidoreductase, chain L|uniref:NADH-quinone oxidoreductase subunit L n=1 Tax=Dehalobacter restrictus TaxID=55583 RepID=A0A857DFF9_9FIRM|nr:MULTISPECIES: NADH-quinone oxidoreductase subunit L [Dehalobacter]AFV03310.1 NADH-ubiquinone oxidoreductase chain L [Dehalobacter sp. DCA]AFV06298.1 NADH-ubiquinone oxidoreductase chain L [Dehalobacter sp. CF]EQB20078.1 NADH-ubiquinone oxidoreductase chain L [Dehalobacter sp. UNSWDHB]QHA00024.1 NADH-quinone oxidoreductase subunit L [Dehalobacter restrictus]